MTLKTNIYCEALLLNRKKYIGLFIFYKLTSHNLCQNPCQCLLNTPSLFFPFGLISNKSWTVQTIFCLYFGCLDNCLFMFEFFEVAYDSEFGVWAHGKISSNFGDNLLANLTFVHYLYCTFYCLIMKISFFSITFQDILCFHLFSKKKPYLPIVFLVC